MGINARFNPTVFAAQLTNLTSGATGFLRFYATNSTGDSWATNSVPFTLVALDPAAFGSHMKVTLRGYTRSEALFSFPALVLLGTNIPGFDYRQFASPTGGDLRFANASGTVLVPHEIDEWNTNGVSSVWVQVPSLTGTNDVVWALWGNPLATKPSTTSTNGAVWSEGFELVWHLKEPVLPHVDSTLKHPATSGVNPARTFAGAVGYGGIFNGSSSYLNAGNIDLGERFTLSVWAKVAPTANSIQTLWASKTGGSTTDGFALFVNSWQTADQRIVFETGNGAGSQSAFTPAATATFDHWHHLAATVDRSTGITRLFMDGSERTVSTSVLTNFGLQRPITFGSFADHLYCFNGVLDEARLESVARSADWIWASWMTVASNATFAASAPVTRERPALFASVQPEAVLLNWPARAVGYRLYSTVSLIDPSWSLVTNNAVLVDENWQAALPLSVEPKRFYRLESSN